MPDDAVTAVPYWLSTVGCRDEFAPPAELPSHTGVVVIGGGLMGVATAYWLSRRDLGVVLLEERGLAHGASGRNAGMMLSGSSPLEAKDLIETVLAEERIDAKYVRTGHLALAASDAVWERVLDEVARRPASSSSLYALRRTECEDLLGMRVDGCFWGGRWLPDGHVVHPAHLVHGLAAAARRRGAVIATQTSATDVSPAVDSGPLSVVTTRGRISADHVVFACNTAAMQFVPMLRDVLKPVRGQMMSTAPLPQIFRMGLAVDWGSVYWRQSDDGCVIVGGCRSGKTTENTAVAEVDPCIQHALERFLPSAFPDFPPFVISRRWAGIMDCTVDDLPIVGALPHKERQWIIGGFGGHGMPAGLGAGNGLACAIATGQPAPVLEAFAPNRFDDGELISA